MQADIALITAISTALGAVAGVASSLLVAQATRRKLNIEAKATQEKIDNEAEKKENDLQTSITKQATDLLVPYREELIRQKQLQEELHKELTRQDRERAAERKLMDARYGELSCRFERLRNDYEVVVAGAWRLVTQLRQAGIEPDWTPNVRQE